MDNIANNSKASQNKKELAQLLAEVAEIKPKKILEVGTWRGWLLDTFQQAFKPEYMLGIEYDKREADPLMDRLYTIYYGDSHDPAMATGVEAYFWGTYIDFLFIDGDHTYEGVKKDFYTYAPLVRPGGIVAFHDVSLTGQKWIDAGVEVNRFWEELTDLIQDKAKYHVIHDPEGQGTGTGVLYL